MSYLMQSTGLRFMADVFAGDPRRINGMYVEYGDNVTVGKRDREYYRTLEAVKGSGYVRVPVTHGYVDDEGIIHFDALITKSDVPKGAGKHIAQCVTLAYLDKDSPENDVLVCTMELNTKVKLRTDAMTTIHTSMRFGGNHE